MSISSEQYKTAIFEMCRRALRVEDEQCRVAYYDMTYQVLEHEGVVVDAEGYEGFRVATERYINCLSDNNLLTAEDILRDSDFDTKYAEYVSPAFAGIGIASTSERHYGDGYVDFSFTFPDGKTQIYRITSPLSSLYHIEINLRFYSTLDYAQKVMPYWDIQPSEDTIPLNELAGNRASFVTNWEAGGLYWHYNSESQEIEFTGEGELKMLPARFTGTTNGLGLGTVMTAIYGAGVKALPSGAFAWGAAGTTQTIVCMHGAADEVTLGGTLANIGTSSNPYTLNIYCDNETIRSGTFGSNVVVSWHALSEWAG